jgi:hypothetical protein
MAYQIDQITHLIAAEQILPHPADSTQIIHFREDLEELIGGNEDPSTLLTEFLASYERFHKARLTAVDPMITAALEQLEVRRAKVAELIARKSTEQRTPEWYIQASRILTASELGGLFGSPRARGQLVMSKAVPPSAEEITRRCSKPLTCPSAFMSPFDWGIRFEPVVKQIYEQKHCVQIADLGRLVHPTDARIAASPDGLIVDAGNLAAARIGCLVEIKCPITREMGDKIPADYYTQMQLQLEVTGLDVCYYVEAKFRSACSARNQAGVADLAGPAIVEGVLWLVEREGARRYVYGPVGCPELVEPPCHLLGQGDVIIERVPWSLMGLNEIKVQRSETWWNGLQPALTAFWADVERARQGEFVVPASTRAPRAKKDEACLIQLEEAAAPEKCQITLDEMFGK